MLPEYDEIVTDLAFDSGEYLHCVASICSPDAPLVVVPSQFEKTVRTNAVFMASLVQCGLNVLRFDFRYHNGESSGTIKNFIPSRTVDDLAMVFDNLAKLGAAPGAPVGMVGISIANRSALRFLAERADALPVSWYGSLLGVIDMEETLQAVLGYNVLDQKRRNRAERHGVKKAVKYEIDFDGFCEDCIDCGLDDLAGSRVDAAKLVDLPVSIVLSEDDEWVSYAKANTFYEESPMAVVDRFVIPNGGHLLDRNVEGAKTAVFALANASAVHLGAPGRIDPSTALTVPEVLSLNELERVREATHRRAR